MVILFMGMHKMQLQIATGLSVGAAEMSIIVSLAADDGCSVVVFVAQIQLWCCVMCDLQLK